VVAVGLLLIARIASAEPSTILNTYVLFAQDNMRVRTLTVTKGNIGVNDGLLYFRGPVAAEQSQIAGDIVHMDSSTSCQKLFSNSLVGGSGGCVDVPPDVPKPLLGASLDLAAACVFPPADDFACSNDFAKDVLVDHDQTTTLAPGVYRNLVVEGGGRGPAVLKLSGDYTFCNVRVGRNGSILFGGPSTVNVAGSSRVSNATRLGPDASLATPPFVGSIHWYVQGSQARFSRKGQIALYACAPNAKMIIGSGTVLQGRFVARSIRLKKSVMQFEPIVPGVCGDTVLSPDEQCETNADCTGGTCTACVCSNGPTTTSAPASSTTTTTSTNGSTTTTTLECETNEDCNVDSPSGGFICVDGHCMPPECNDDEDCNQSSPGGGFVCEDHHCVPGTTTTTTTTTGAPTTTSPRSTTTTTLKQCSTTEDCPVGVCKDGVCVPECDSDDDCMGSPDMSFVCLDGRCYPGPEICGDCRDNDGDGLVDFEDPDCCDAGAGQLFDMDLRKGRLRKAKTSTSVSSLRLKGTLAKSGLASKIALPGQHVGIQIRTNAGEVLCAAVPSGSFGKKKQTYRFSRKKTPVPSDIGRDLDRVMVKVTKKGQVKFRVKAKRAALVTPAEGILRITVGFTTKGGPASQNVCSQAVRLFRGGKGGQLRFP
jgi:hypothetical protein